LFRMTIESGKTATDKSNRCFLVYKSSAGSGKTFTLVKEYLKLVLVDTEGYKSVLGLTFTNKAANEMKYRILDYLKSLSGMHGNSNPQGIAKYLLPVLVQETGLPDNVIIENSAIALRKILHNYSFYSIGTIDSFMHKLVRTFAFDLKIPLDFKVELDSQVLLRKAVDQLIGNAGIDPALTSFLIGFVTSRLDEEKTWRIEIELAKYAKHLLSEEGQFNVRKLNSLTLEDFKEIQGKIHSSVSGFENEMSDLASEIIHLIDSNHIRMEAFYQGRSGIYSYFKRLALNDFSKVSPNSYVQATTSDDKWCSGKATPTEKMAIEHIKGRILFQFERIQQNVASQYATYVLLKLVGANLYSLALLNEIEKQLEKLKFEENLVHISEFNRRVLQIVIDEPVPYIYERLGVRYKHFLIDEFQDTSLMQWQNILPLVDNSLSEQKLNIIVGDAKQAIYRWRGGDIEQFMLLPEVLFPEKAVHIIHRENNLKRNYQEVVLAYNYRSDFEVVRFNNLFFETVSEVLPEGFRMVYNNHNQLTHKEESGGYVQIRRICNEDKQTFVSGTLDFLIEEIESLKSMSYSLSDIGIICRKNEEASLVAKHLIENGISVVSSEALLLKTSPGVNLILAVIRLLNYPDNRTCQYTILMHLYTKSIIDEVSLNKLVFTAKPVPGSLEESYPGTFKNILNEKGIDISSLSFSGFSLYDMCEEIIRVFNLAMSDDIYLSFFLDAVHKYSQLNGNDQPGFLNWWEDKKNELSVSFPENTNAVSIMTIHKAKGLEFPVVFFPFAVENLKSTRDTIWVQPGFDLIDNLETATIPVVKKVSDTKFATLYEKEMNKSLVDMVNLVYVAFTRPRERLYVITADSDDNEGVKSVTGLINYFVLKNNLVCDGEGKIEFGKYGGSNKKAQVISTPAPYILKLISQNWHTRITISFQKVTQGGIIDKLDSIEWGNLIHELLGRIYIPQDITNLDEIITQMGVYSLSENEILNLKQILGSVISRPELAEYFRFGNEIMNEHEILMPEGEVVRPDRLIIEKTGVTIIEYKTGIPMPSHTKQVLRYCGALELMGYKVKNKFLVYINRNGSELIRI